MAKINIDITVLNNVKKYIKKLSKYYNINKVYLFGSYAKEINHENSDIDVAIVIDSNKNTFDLMMLTQDIDLRMEPHPIKLQGFKNGNPFVQEVIDTGIKLK